MPSFLTILLRRLLAIPIALIIITAIIYAVSMLAPPESRAWVYWPFGVSVERMSEQEQLRIIHGIIQKQELDDPFLAQYGRWLAKLVQGDWGYSPVLHQGVLPYLIARTPITIELTLYSMLVFIPLGLISGVFAGWKHGRAADHGFRLAAFIGTATPPFILAMALLSIFYVGLRWFPIGRLDPSGEIVIRSASFQTYTGLLTIDSVLNGRWDITLSAIHHLILPVFTLSLVHWATLGRMTRALAIEELSKDYITVAYSKGLKTRQIIWAHAMRNAFVPALTSSALSTASLLTGVYVVEMVFGLHGVSEVLRVGFNMTLSGMLVLDISPIMGLAVYSTTAVLTIMFLLDIIQIIVDPRLRESVTAA